MKTNTSSGKNDPKKKTPITRETRRAILNSARRLYNEQGVTNVSMRTIAADVDISVGNLTYYFPKKKDLVSALMTDDIEETIVREPMEGLARLNSVFEGMLRSLLRNPFFFLDDQVRTMIGAQETVNIQQVHGQIDPVLDEMIAKGLLSPDFQGNTRKDVMGILLLSHISWLKSVVRPDPLFRLTLQEILGAHWTVLYPWLTDEGREEYDRVKTEWAE